MGPEDLSWGTEGLFGEGRGRNACRFDFRLAQIPEKMSLRGGPHSEFSGRREGVWE